MNDIFQCVLSRVTLAKSLHSYLTSSLWMLCSGEHPLKSRLALEESRRELTYQQLGSGSFCTEVEMVLLQIFHKSNSDILLSCPRFYLCVYVCLYIYTYMHIYTHMYICISEWHKVKIFTKITSTLLFMLRFLHMLSSGLDRNKMLSIRENPQQSELQFKQIFTSHFFGVSWKWLFSSLPSHD